MKLKSITLLAVLLQAALSFGQTKNFIDQPFIETRASVDTLVTPDEIYLNIIITEKDTKGKTSVEELESKMESTLRQIGIDTKEDLTLNDLASNFKKYFLKQLDVHKSKSYTLKVDDAIKAGRVIIELERIDISNVELDRTEYSKIDELKMVLKSKAILKAKKQATFMSEPLGQKVGAAIFISDQSDHNSYDVVYGANASAMYLDGFAARQEKFKPADIEFEKIKVESTVAVKFKLEE